MKENEGNETAAGWRMFHEKMVMLQLREPYVGCTYKHTPAMDPSGAGMRAVPILSGTLFVEPDGNGGVLLVLRMPTGNGSDFAVVAVKPEDVVFTTHIHEQRVITQ